MVKILLCTTLLLATVCFRCYAADESSTVAVVAAIAGSDMLDGIDVWTDNEMIKNISKVPVNDNDIKLMYSAFKSVLVTPPNPNTYNEYGIPNGEEALRKVKKVGQKVHNMFLAISDMDFLGKYMKLLTIMRDALYLESKGIELAIKHDNSRDLVWYELHNRLLRDAEKEYASLFNKR